MQNLNHFFHHMLQSLCPSYLHSLSKHSLLTYNHLHYNFLNHLSFSLGVFGERECQSQTCLVCCFWILHWYLIFLAPGLFAERGTDHERQKTNREKSSQCVDEYISCGCRKDFLVTQDEDCLTFVEFSSQSSSCDSFISPTFEYLSCLCQQWCP